MLFSEMYAKIEEKKARETSVDGRRFNVRSKIKMEREAALLMRNSEKEVRKKQAKRRNNRSVFSEEELREGEEARILFREEMSKKRKLCEGERTQEPEEEGDL